MKKIKLYIAQTEDGFVAEKDGSVRFLNDLPMDDASAKRYEGFLSSIDVVITASNTYKQIIEELIPDAWPYVGKKTYVFSNSIKESKYDDIFFVSGDVKKELAKIVSTANGDIWLMGGADLIKQFHDNDLIDEYIVTTVPVSLGSGIELFADSIDLTKLKKISHNEHGVFKEDVYIKQ